MILFYTDMTHIKRGGARMKTILIVEDNKLNMKLFNDLLQAHGYKIYQSSDGKDIVQLVRKYCPDLIIMDIQLPEICGLDCTRLLKAEDDLKDIPVVAVTAHALKGDETAIMEAGCDGYIAKPITVPNFLQTVASFII